jgi:hypothetical protein
MAGNNLPKRGSTSESGALAMNKKHHEFGKNGIRIRYEKAVVLFLCPGKAMPVIEAGLERSPI